ncbi:hypothetical protein E8E12_000696 [Didymella heteroderae]|uniref:Mtf2-like C-terminal domain-containing protein n=1 Tax=Didymella heteroderae TaxID=1769908 RepID=A0A9P4WGJ3_9PLEO|nr:hypothetical protein E8E12_000696 [Didymella heteroderae]
MSACSTTLRALSRSRVPTHKTLLPFLYQTATIQQWKPAAQPIARRSISRYSPKDEPAPTEDIPFEDKGNLPPAFEDLESPRKTTITGSERAAFEKLYRKFNTRGSRQQEKDHEVEIDAIADEYWEPDEEEDPEGNLDRIFDEALKKGAAVSREWNRSSTEQLRSRKPKQDLASMAQHVLKGTSPEELRARDSRTRKREEASASAIKLKKARLAERERIDSLLTSATTDRELWETLHREVFDRVRALDLDSTAPKPRSPRSKSKSPSTPAPTDPKILFANYPHHLLTALTTLRNTFPASQLPLSLLPTVKSLGRSSYALGATTALYTLLLRTAWLQQSSYPLIISLLTDMHNGAIEFSPEVLGVLDAVVKEFDMARSGRLGREMQMVYGMEQFGEGIREVRRWRAIVAERVGVDDGRREKGTVPVPRRRVESREKDHVPLVEGVNGLNESANDQTQHERVEPADETASAPSVHDIDPRVEFGFLEDTAEEVPRTKEANGEPSAEAGELQEKPDAQADENLRDEVQHEFREEQDKTADKSEAAAKTSTGEPAPWTPS